MTHDGFGAAVSDTATMIDRSIRLTRRNVDTLFVSILLPLLMMALFVYVFGGAISTGTEYINYVVPGILLLTTGYGASNTAMAVADDMTTGMIDRLRSLPIRSFAVLTGHVTASVARNAISTAIVLLASLAMGFRPDAGPLDWLGAIGLLLLYVVALSWLAAALGVIAKSVESASTLSFFMLFVPYLSSAFVQVETMPAFLRPISEHQPITPVIETVRGFLTGTGMNGTGWIALAWCTGLFLFSFTLATVLFRRRARG
ncbi:ABC-2 type transport system permease protein [Kribbella orskensis]|uniref:Transport permease protein n=1 Tax=Kribbella orskensis TaxID=2512216 RepID=A0ABY2BCG7_9ACTN|nr:MULTISPECIES: ABC transporter permease [Kribbella]TCN35090.1 ABC-2 type transport system permease protein [Kribbella sp. VKM Ac-2500]TCO16457.1 ABC-2 type transport system permease protein [Kribbella orskensis]